MDMRATISASVDALAKNISAQPLFCGRCNKKLPSRNAILEVVDELQKLMFPGYFGDEDVSGSQPEYFIGYALTETAKKLTAQIEAALLYEGPCGADDAARRAEAIGARFIAKLAGIQRMLMKDVEAGFNGDPAAKSLEEIIVSYPGLYAIYVYRIAHELYVEHVPFIPRIMTEYAHGRTGIDINSGAVIGENFFIDHGTGVVIGETTVIGKNVKVYQGVTLGALSTRSGQQLAGVKRHPTIGDNVTIYSGASILGGETVIGDDVIIGGNAFITKSVPANTKVSMKAPELTFKGPHPTADNWEI